MIIKKEYKFYAAHRNAQLSDKCRNIHGHRYGIIVHFEVERDGALSTLFRDFDAKIQPHLKKNYDHGLLIDVNDPVFPVLQKYVERTGDPLRFNRFVVPTTVENLGYKLFCEFTEFGFRIDCIEVRETDTSVIFYTREDWIADSRRAATLAEPPGKIRSN